MTILSINIKSRFFNNNKGDRFCVLRDIHLDIKEGEFVCIVGPSGCGKSTLLNIIAALDNEYDGEVIYKGEPLKYPTPKIILIFQELGLFPWLNVQKNIEFGLRINNTPKKEREKKVLQYLEMMNLLKFKDSFIYQLSGGMRQRVALARALIMEPDILLMDEPFASLDALTRDILHDELQRIWSLTKKTIIFVTHNVREAVCLGDRVIVFSPAPATIKEEFKINLPRPRQIESEGLIELVRPILTELKKEEGIAGGESSI